MLKAHIGADAIGCELPEGLQTIEQQRVGLSGASATSLVTAVTGPMLQSFPVGAVAAATEASNGFSGYVKCM